MINSIKIIFLAILLQKASCQELDAAPWSYQDINGWGNISPICNTGRSQSPINLKPDAIGLNNGRPPVELFNHKSQLQQATLENNGHTVRITGTWQGNVPTMTGSVVFSKEVYNFSSLHVHWSTANNNGTEHSIQGQKYAAELHLVYLNSKYQSANEAMNSRDGIAVLGILLYVNNTVAPNLGMRALASLLGSVQNPGDSTAVTRFCLSEFIPNPVRSWYSYYGSLTTPNCSENVRWVVVSEPQPITTQIITALRSVNLDNNDRQNVRPLQAANNRLVEFYG